MSELIVATVEGPGLKPIESIGAIRWAEAPRSLREAKGGVPQRLKPESGLGGYGTAEAVPLSKTARVGASERQMRGSLDSLRSLGMTASNDGMTAVDGCDVNDAEDGAPFDKLREECGIMAVYGHSDAARMTFWGLYALQHRGQESAGIASADGHDVNDIKGMGLVSEIFTDDVLARLPGHIAIGHTRYSTTGDSALLNAQPISVELTMGLIAIAHNGNLVNLGNSRARLERDGAVFQTTSDSEIIVQLIAHSRCNTLVDCIAESLAQVDGAFSIVMMTRNRVFAARGPAWVQAAVELGGLRGWTARRTRLCLPRRHARSTCCTRSMSAT